MPKATKVRLLAGEPASLKEVLEAPVLCIGVDVTWWGGGKDKNSRKETIAWTYKEKEWTTPSFARVDLEPFNSEADAHTPNSDPDGSILLKGIFSVIRRFPQAKHVVVALDAPLAAEDKDLGQRTKAPARGEVQRRAADSRFAAAVSSSPKGWREVRIQPGTPLAPRIASIVEKLKAEDFRLFPDSGAKVLIECFPNEAVWSAGVSALCGELNYKAMTAYKRAGKCKLVLPTTILQQIFEYTIDPCLQAACLNSQEWLKAAWDWLSGQKAISTKGMGITGKTFDDAVDSLLSLIAAIAFADGHAHVHRAQSPLDGHIIGPGHIEAMFRRKQDT